ncbi:MAG: AAA family ATPase [Clostridia bacterium]
MSSYEQELVRERIYMADVQQLLLAVIDQARGDVAAHDETIHAMLSDAWAELRTKPTALSTQDLEQLSSELNTTLARKALRAQLKGHYDRMVLSPFFGRVDFAEGENPPERINIGLYSLQDAQGHLVVNDWRAPICTLYYDATPGKVRYDSPSGVISGLMTRKRQYRVQDGKLLFFVDTDLSIDDSLLLDILSRATTRRMRSIVSTIQREQNLAIRKEDAQVLIVVGSAGSGKTSIAMHRIAYLLFHQKSALDASRVAVLSPGSAFTDYISTVLPDLGEENTHAFTLPEVLKKMLGLEIETPLKQNEKLIAGDSLRIRSVQYKCSAAFSHSLDHFAEGFRNMGPQFATLSLGKHRLCEKQELERMYRIEFRLLNPALRLTRLKTILQSRLDDWSRSLSQQYERRLTKDYRGLDLSMATRMAVSQQLKPVRKKMNQMLDIDPLSLYAQALEGAPDGLDEAARQNADARTIWWEDAPGIAYLQLLMGFAPPDKHILHLLIDEAQDYPDVAMRLLAALYPSAHVTLLGDPNQRTAPGLDACDPRTWGDCFGKPDANLITLSKCYRSTVPIMRLCHALVPAAGGTGFGRDGQEPLITVFDESQLSGTLAEWQADPAIRSIAVITRSQAQAVSLSKKLPGCLLLTGAPGDMLPDNQCLVAASYHLMKGLEFDAVAVIWPDCALTEDEKRRLYTACSRSLHRLCLMTEGALFQALEKNNHESV